MFRGCFFTVALCHRRCCSDGEIDGKKKEHQRVNVNVSVICCILIMLFGAEGWKGHEQGTAVDLNGN